jgi:hypothetical protein
MDPCSSGEVLRITLLFDVFTAPSYQLPNMFDDHAVCSN